MPVKDLAVGVDIGGTNTVFGFVDRKGHILAEGHLKTSQYKDIESFAAALYGRIIAAGHRISHDFRIRGFGIGAPMGNINKGTIEYPAGLPWKGFFPFAEIFHRHTSLPVIVTNDANAAAVGEMIFGGAKGMKNFVVITLGTGLGSGFVVDGKLVYGHSGFAGEIGHTRIRPEPSGRECGCGKKGCLETYVSATGLKRTMIKILADSRSPSKLRNYSIEKLDSKMIFDAAKKGDPLARLAFDKTGRLLGYKLADVTAHTNPEAIFLFGGLALAGDMLFKPTIESMEENLLGIYKGRVKVIASRLNSKNAAVLGASSLIWTNEGI